MKSIDDAEAQARLEEILEEAQHRRVTAVVLTPPLARPPGDVIRSNAVLANDSSLASAANCMTVTSEKLLDILRAISTSSSL